MHLVVATKDLVVGRDEKSAVVVLQPAPPLVVAQASEKEVHLLVACQIEHSLTIVIVQLEIPGRRRLRPNYDSRPTLGDPPRKLIVKLEHSLTISLVPLYVQRYVPLQKGDAQAGGVGIR